jgi:hypothetical protein
MKTPNAADPGPPATRARSLEARRKAQGLIEKIKPLNIPKASEYIQKRYGLSRQTADMFAVLAFDYESEKASRSRKGRQRIGSIREMVRRLDIHSMAKARRDAPELFANDRDPEIVRQAISRWNTDRQKQK